MSLKTTMTKLVVDLCSTIDYVTHIFLNILIFFFLVFTYDVDIFISALFIINFLITIRKSWILVHLVPLKQTKSFFTYYVCSYSWPLDY